jgi:DNA modification methylase
MILLDAKDVPSDLQEYFEPVQEGQFASVLKVATQPYSAAHFATWPSALVEPMIKAGSRPGDTVLDPFSGSGTTGKVALELGRRYIGVDISAAYLDDLAPDRMAVTIGMGI